MTNSTKQIEARQVFKTNSWVSAAYRTTVGDVVLDKAVQFMIKSVPELSEFRKVVWDKSISWKRDPYEVILRQSSVEVSLEVSVRRLGGGWTSRRFNNLTQGAEFLSELVRS